MDPTISLYWRDYAVFPTVQVCYYCQDCLLDRFYHYYRKRHGCCALRRVPPFILQPLFVAPFVCRLLFGAFIGFCQLGLFYCSIWLYSYDFNVAFGLLPFVAVSPYLKFLSELHMDRYFSSKFVTSSALSSAYFSIINLKSEKQFLNGGTIYSLHINLSPNYQPKNSKGKKSIFYNYNLRHLKCRTRS